MLLTYTSPNNLKLQSIGVKCGITQYRVNSLLNHKILDQSKLKAFADGKINFSKTKNVRKIQKKNTEGEGKKCL